MQVLSARPMLLAITALLHCSVGSISFLEKDYDVVRPIEQHHWPENIKNNIPNEINYRFTLFGKEVEIHLLRNQRMISEDYTETYYTKSGTQVTTPHHMDKDQCYYLGGIIGDSLSAIAVSTCDGLSGVIRTAGQEYAIVPLEGTVYGDHAVIKSSTLPSALLHCGADNTSALPDFTNYASRGSSPTTSPLDIQKFITMYLVVDHKEYLKMQSDIDIIRTRMFQILNFVNMVYKPLRTAVVLVGLDIWSDEDKIDVSSDSLETLSGFTNWRNDVLLKRRPHDNAQLVTAQQFSGGIVGTAYIRTMCSEYSTGVVQDHSSSVLSTAATFAHELGHNLGMRHDDILGKPCPCADAECIMTSSLSDSVPRHFSSCSVESYESFLENTNVMSCLRTNPFHRKIIPVCGNGLLEEGEQCDCGTPEDCTDPCCEPLQCNFTKGSQCASGECCKDCQFIKVGRQCRAQADECDLPEYCTGVSAKCPENTFMQDGNPCANNTGYCFNGHCPTRLGQCQEQMGNDLLEADEDCYQLNSTKDNMCKILMCTNKSKCDSTHSQPLNGTKCAEGKVCMDKKCVELVKAYGMDNCHGNCKGHKVCNNKLECQCKAGWIPPHCDTMHHGTLHLTQSKPPPSHTGEVIGIVVTVVAVATILIIMASIATVWICRRNGKCTRQQSQGSTESSKGLDNSGFQKENVQV